MISASRAANRMIKICRISLRSLLLTVTAIAVCMGVWTERANRQKATVDTLRNLKSFIVYDYYVEFIGFEGRRLFDRREPSKLSGVLGIDFCHNAVEVHVPFRIPRNDAIRLLRQLPRLRRVSLPFNDYKELPKLKKELQKELPGVEIDFYPTFVG